jgi:hypothetical protein
MQRSRSAALLVLAAAHVSGLYARGVSPYLPLNLDPEVEHQIERVLILAGKPVMTRPIPAATVFDALPKACEIDAVLCERVRKFLNNYMHNTGVEFASIEGAVTNGSNPVLPNQHGMSAQSPFQVAAGAYIQPSSYALLSLGGVAYQGRETPTGSMLSLGFDRAQLDIGYRDHWWSPMTDSSMLISTEAPTMPSITLSNYEPLTRLGIHYEAFVARMSYSDRIELTDGALTAGYPKFGGLQMSIEPVSGWSLSGQRIIVWGGGAAGGQSASSILQAFFNPSKAQSTGFGTEQDVIGKQEASVSSRFVFPGKVPFAMYFEYAGNDTSRGSNLLFGKPDLSGGVQFPHLGPFDLVFEVSQWSPTWYVHAYNAVQTGYGDGITNYQRSIGNWFGDQRVFGDAVGGRSSLLRMGWEPSFGGRLEAEYRMLINDSYYSQIAYRHENMGSVSYSYPWKGYAVGAELDVGRDVFGGHFTRIAGFMRYGDALPRGDADSTDSSFNAPHADGAEFYVDAGVTGNRILEDIIVVQPRFDTPIAYGPHFGVGARRQASQHQDLGVGLEVDDIQGRSLVSARMIDYRYRFNSPLALDLYAGASRYSLGTPAFGWYLGGGPQWRNVLPGWDVGFDFRYGVKVARQRVLPTDPQGGYRPDSFYDIYMGTLYIARKF